MNKKVHNVKFYSIDFEQNAKKSKKKSRRVLRGRKKVVSLQSKTNGKVRFERGGRFDGSLKEWNGCSKQLEDFFEAQR